MLSRSQQRRILAIAAFNDLWRSDRLLADQFFAAMAAAGLEPKDYGTKLERALVVVKKAVAAYAALEG